MSVFVWYAASCDKLFPIHQYTYCFIGNFTTRTENKAPNIHFSKPQEHKAIKGIKHQTAIYANQNKANCKLIIISTNNKARKKLYCPYYWINLIVLRYNLLFRPFSFSQKLEKQFIKHPQKMVLFYYKSLLKENFLCFSLKMTNEV